MSSADSELNDDTFRERPSTVSVDERSSTDTLYERPSIDTTSHRCSGECNREPPVHSGGEDLLSEENCPQNQPSESSRIATTDRYQPQITYPRISLDELQTLFADRRIMGMREDRPLDVKWRERVHFGPQRKPKTEISLQDDQSVRRIVHTEARNHITLLGDRDNRPPESLRTTKRSSLPDRVLKKFDDALSKVWTDDELVQITFSVGRDFAERVPAAAEKLTAKPMSYFGFYTECWARGMGPKCPHACLKVARRKMSDIAKIILAEPSQSTESAPITTATNASLKALWDKKALAREVVFTTATTRVHDGKEYKRYHALTIDCDPEEFELAS